MKKRIKWVVLIMTVILLFTLSASELFYRNSDISKSMGTVGNGSIENAWLLPYSRKNYKYFSPLSYFILNDGYVHSRVFKTIVESYAKCEANCGETKFRIMEASCKKGGKTLIHRTHQNGLSVDFMVPKKKGSKPRSIFDRLGMWHYLLDFNNTGTLNLNNNKKIDFETMGKHILALDDAARKNALRIKKVILMIELKNDFFKTTSGIKVKQRGIYFARALTPAINKLHDDHYHVDFEIIN